MPAACSAEILLALVGPREVVSSNSIPGNRDLKLSVMLFLSSALAGIPATTLPSFLAASIVLSHSVCPLVFISAALGAPRGIQAKHVTRKIKTWIRFNLPPSIIGRQKP